MHSTRSRNYIFVAVKAYIIEESMRQLQKCRYGSLPSNSCSFSPVIHWTDGITHKINKIISEVASLKCFLLSLQIFDLSVTKLFSSPLTTVIVERRFLKVVFCFFFSCNGLGTDIFYFIRFCTAVLSAMSDDSCKHALDLKHIRST